MNGFLVLWPKCHLLDVVFFVTCSMTLFCIIDMWAFWSFGVVSIGTSKCMDGLNVMDEGVILGYAEIIMNFEPDHDVLVTIKGV